MFRTIAGVLLFVALAISVMITCSFKHASADGKLDSQGRRIDCIPADFRDPAGDCLYVLPTDFLKKFEIKVEYEYPYCEVKLDVDYDLDLSDVPEGATIIIESAMRYIDPEGNEYTLFRNYGNHINANFPEYDIHYLYHRYGSLHQMPIKYKQDELNKFQQFETAFKRFPQTTLGSVFISAYMQYSGIYSKQVRVNREYIIPSSKFPSRFRSNYLPYSHTFAGLAEEMWTCFEVAEREESRVAEKDELDSEKAGLRQSLVLLESELSRARSHEEEATETLNQVIALSTKVEDLHRTINRIRIEGLAERRKMISRYFGEEAEKYSVFMKSLEAAEQSLVASDAAIAAHKAELEQSKQNLQVLISSAQEAEAGLITEIENTKEVLGND